MTNTVSDPDQVLPLTVCEGMPFIQSHLESIVLRRPVCQIQWWTFILIFLAAFDMIDYNFLHLETLSSHISWATTSSWFSSYRANCSLQIPASPGLCSPLLSSSPPAITPLVTCPFSWHWIWLYLDDSKIPILSPVLSSELQIHKPNCLSDTPPFSWTSQTLGSWFPRLTSLHVSLSQPPGFIHLSKWQHCSSRCSNQHLASLFLPLFSLPHTSHWQILLAAPLKYLWILSTSFFSAPALVHGMILSCQDEQQSPNQPHYCQTLPCLLFTQPPEPFFKAANHIMPFICL